MCSNAKDSGLLAKDLIVRLRSSPPVCFLTGNLKVSGLGKDLFRRSPTAPATIKALCDYYNSFPKKKRGALCVL